MTARWVVDLWQELKPGASQRADKLASLVAEMRDIASAEQVSRVLGEAVSLAHQLAGSLGSYGLPEGSRLAKHLESQLLGKEGGDPSITAAHLRQAINAVRRDA